MSDLAQISTLALAACFAWAALAKLTRPRRWRASLRAYRLSRLTDPAAAAVPALELGAAALLLADARAGAVFATVLLAFFSLAVARARSGAGDRLPCACFGGRRERDWRAIVARNAGLGCVAVIVIFTADGSGFEALSLLTEGDGPAAALVAVGLALAAWTAGATRTALRR